MLKDKILSASGGGVDPIFSDDVFATHLYTGNGSTQTINNGIDLAGKGGLVWAKQRNGTGSNYLADTLRGTQNYLSSNNTNAQGGDADGVTSFNSNGFTGGGDVWLNGSSRTYVSWTFREAEKFFDVVTYTGNGTGGRAISHALGSVPGCMIIKRTDTTGNWAVYHRSTGNTGGLRLNATDAFVAYGSYWFNTTPTATEFTVGNNTDVNASGGTYVAYLFAHNAGGFGATGNDNVISCGGVTTSGNRTATVDIGFEPQWILLKNTNVSTADWLVFDSMRGLVGTADGQSVRLYPNLSSSDDPITNGVYVTPTGFYYDTGIENGVTGTSFIYIAIRRPMKPPTSGTQVFSPVLIASSTTPTTIVDAGFPSDLTMGTYQRTSMFGLATDRLRGGSGLRTTSTAAEETNSVDFDKFDQQNGVRITQGAGNNNIWWNFRRAPGFFDVVCYTGTGVARTVEHNLGVAPELMIVKQRNTAQDWLVYAAPLGNNKALYLNFTDASTTRTEWNNTTPTSSVFSVSTNVSVNQSGGTYVTYLFASAAGISKVGSYTGNGTSQTIDCGFAAGARFVLIKRTDNTGNWVTFDTARGIVSGNDPALYLNSTAAEVTGIDGIDPANSGFIVNQESTFNLNVNAATYIFLAIA